MKFPFNNFVCVKSKSDSDDFSVPVESEIPDWIEQKHGFMYIIYIILKKKLQRNHSLGFVLYYKKKSNLPVESITLSIK